MNGRVKVVLLSGFLVSTALICQLAEAQSKLSELLENASDGKVELLSTGTVGQAELTGSIEISGRPTDKPSMKAPFNQAILVIREGSTLKLSNVVLQQARQTRFALYIDGGSVELDNCEFSGAFEAGIHLVSGDLTVRNSSFAGGIRGISAQQGSHLEVFESSFTDLSRTAIYSNNAVTTLDQITIQGHGQTGIYLAGKATTVGKNIEVSGSSNSHMVLVDGVNAEFSDLFISGKGGHGLVAEAMGSLSLDRFLIQTTGDAIQATKSAVSIKLQNGVIEASPESLAVYAENPTEFSMESVQVQGGKAGLVLKGSLPSVVVADNQIVGQTLYGARLESGGPNQQILAQFVRNELISAGGGISIAGSGPGSLILESNRMLVHGASSIHVDDSLTTTLSGNRVVSAPAEYSKDVVLYRLDDPMDRAFLPDGPPNPVSGEFIDGGNNSFLSHAALVSLATVSDNLRFELASYAETGVIADASGLGVALMSPGPEPPSMGRIIALELAPPAPGWRWSPDALSIKFESVSGERYLYAPGDFPVELPQAVYRVSVNDKPVSVLSLEEPQAIEIPDTGEPYLAWKSEDGTLVRGDTLSLRAPNVLDAMLKGKRVPYINEALGTKTYYLARENAEPGLVEEALERARTQLGPAVQKKLEAERMKNWDTSSIQSLVQKLYFDLLAEFGTAFDVDWIYDNFQSDNRTKEAIEAAVRLEQRLGLLENGRTLQEVEKAISDPDYVNRIELVSAFARTGDMRGLAALAYLHEAAANEAKENELVSFGLEILYLAPPEIANPIYRDFLEKFGRLVRLQIADEDTSYLISPMALMRAGVAIAYLSVAGELEDRRLFNIPMDALDQSTYLMAAYIDNPLALYAARFGEVTAIPDHAMFGWGNSSGRVLCPSLDFRSQKEVQRITEEASEILWRAVIRRFYPNWSKLNQMDRRSVGFWFDLWSSISYSHCLLTGKVINLGLSESAAKEEESKFSKSGYDPQWWVRPVRAQKQMEFLASGKPFPDFAGLSPLDSDYLLGFVGENSEANPELLAAFEYHHRLLSNSFQAPQWIHSFQAERRVFRLRSAGNDGSPGNGSTSIAGHVDFRFQKDGDFLVIAVRNSVLSGDFSGFAALMTQDDRTPFEVEHRKKMFERLTLEQRGESINAELVATTPTGVLLFRAPFNGSLENSYLRVKMRYVDTTWDFDIALHSSSLAVTQRQASTTFRLPGEGQ